MTKEKQSLSVDVEKVADESLHRRFTTPRGKGDSEKHVVDTVNYTPNPRSASSGGWSTSFGSPFAPNPRGVKELLGEKTGTSSETSKPSYHFDDWHALDKRTHWELEKMAAPEKILTIFAMRLALLEKIATTVGKLNFIWATVVLLGGFAVTLKSLDFWIVTLILLTEGARIFVRSHELELEHQSPGQGNIKTMNMGLKAIHKSTVDKMKTVFSRLIMLQGSKSKHQQGDALRSLNLSRAWSSSQVSLIPHMWAIFKAERVVAILNFMQVLSAVLSIGISVWRLFHAYEYVEAGGNHTGALIMFYSLTVFEALVFLIERAYWQYKLRVEDILHTVNNSCTGFKLDEDCYTVRCFFYDVYAMCLTQSVFEGLKMDLVEYSLQWLQSNVHVEQLHGVRALFAFSCNPESSQETLRTIRRRQGAVERLLEMVTWKKQEENDLREAAASLLCKLVAYDRTGTRVAAIAGSIEAICSLLTEDIPDDHQAYLTGEYTSTVIDESPRPANHVQTGLRILITMAKNTINCARIGATKGLLARLISFIDAQKLNMAGDEFRKVPAEETVWFLSLELLSLLAACPGASGKSLRQDIVSNLVFVPNLRNILNFKGGRYRLQELAAGTLSSLAMDAYVREVIGRTGGIMQSLFSLFLTDAMGKMVSKEEMKVAITAGKALMLLALQDSDNCSRMVRLSQRLITGQSREAVELVKGSGNNMAISGSVNLYQKKDVVNALMELMGDSHRGYLAISILCRFCDNNVEGIHKIRIAAVTSQVMGLAMVEKEDERAQDAAIGLAARTLPLLRAEEVEKLFSSGEFTKEDVSMMIVRKLEAHKEPSMKLPWVRRVCLELVVALVDCDRAFWGLFAMSERFVRSLDNVAATSSDLENYVTFSGAVGVAFHFITMEHLIQTVTDKLQLQQ